jgi:hypothetical protein
MSEDKINVGKEVAALLQKLGLEPAFVKELHITPTKATATVFKKDVNGSKYMEPSEQVLPTDDEDSEVFGFSHHIAVETLYFDVRT